MEHNTMIAEKSEELCGGCIGWEGNIKCGIDYPIYKEMRCPCIRCLVKVTCSKSCDILTTFWVNCNSVPRKPK